MFVKWFIEILKKHTQYLILSGFISIATEITRETEDVDVLIPIIEPTGFKKLFNELQEKDF